MSFRPAKRRSRSNSYASTSDDGTKSFDGQKKQRRRRSDSDEGAGAATQGLRRHTRNQKTNKQLHNSQCQNDIELRSEPSSAYAESQFSSPSSCSSLASGQESPPRASRVVSTSATATTTRTSRRKRKRKRHFGEEHEKHAEQEGGGVQGQEAEAEMEAEVDVEVEAEAVSTDAVKVVRPQSYRSTVDHASSCSTGPGRCNNSSDALPLLPRPLPGPLPSLPPSAASRSTNLCVCAPRSRGQQRPVITPAAAAATVAAAASVPVPAAFSERAHPHNPLMGMANAAELLRTSSPELQPITINAVNALLSVSPKTEPAPSPMNGLGALASLASLQDLTPKSRREAIERLQESGDGERPMGARAGQRPRHATRATCATRAVTTSLREQARERERERTRRLHYFAGGSDSDCEVSREPELLPQYAFPDSYNKEGRIGMFTPKQRKAMLARWHRKRKNRVWGKVVRYGCRKNLANGRVRIKGRFVKSTPENVAMAAVVSS